MSFDNLTRELEQIQRAVGRDFRPALREVDTYLTQKISQGFALRQEPDGVPWANRPSGEPATLIKGRDLINSLVNGGPGSIRDITSDHLERGTTVGYSPFMQYGVPKRKGKRRKAKAGPPKPGSKAAARMARMRGVPRSRRRRSRRRIVGPIQMRVAARPFLGLTDQDADKIAVIGADYIADQLVKA